MLLRYSLVLTVLVALLSAVPVAAQQTDGGPPALFKGAAEGPAALSRVGTTRMETLQQDSTTQSIRLVRIADDLSQRRALQIEADRETGILSPNVAPSYQQETAPAASGRAMSLTLNRDGISALRERTYAWTGTVRGGPSREKIGGATLIRSADGSITGTLRLGQEFFLVRPLNGELHALVRVDESKYPRRRGNSPRHSGSASSGSSPSSTSSIIPSTSPSPSRKQTCAASTKQLSGDRSASSPASSSAEPSPRESTAAPCSQYSADVLALYTSAAANGRDIQGIIDLAIQESDDAYDNSDAGYVDLNLAHSQQTSINESGNIENDLANLRTSGTVQSLRDQYDADLVVLLTGDVYGGVIGLADEIRAEAGDAFAIAAAPFATGGSYTFPHEVGHLQGGQHHPADATCTPGATCDNEGDLFADAFGHRFTVVDDCAWWNPFCSPDYNNYRTIMSYNPGGYSAIKHFSDPDVTFNGEPTGTSSRQNASAFRTTFSTVKDFRTPNDLQANFTVTGDLRTNKRTFTASACGGGGAYSYTWRFSYNGPGNYGPPVSSQKSFTRTFPEGTHYAKLTVTTGSQSATSVRSFYVSGECDSRTPCLKTAGVERSSSDTTASALQSTRTDTEAKAIPSESALHGAAPNPFRSSTHIAYDLPERTDVTLAVYDLMGRRVKQLATGRHGAGTHRVRLDASALPSGVYVVRLRAGGAQKTQRITVLK